MAARGTSKRQRNRARRRVLGAIPVALGVLLWGGAAIMRDEYVGYCRKPATTACKVFAKQDTDG